MSPELCIAARALDEVKDLEELWQLFETQVAAQGFPFFTYLARHRAHPEASAQVTGRANFPIYASQPMERDPLLTKCTDSYRAVPTGSAFLAELPHLDIGERQMIRHAETFGFRSGIGLPVRITGDRAVFNLGTGMDRDTFLSEVMPRRQQLHVFCMLMQRRLDTMGAAAPRPGPSDLLDRLSGREHQVLELLAQGLSRPEVAHRLCVSAHTVASHAKAIYRKLGVHTQTGAVRAYLETAGGGPVKGPPR
ncbi:LuxR family transcriptional regulator [Mesobaculum littorinae]|uniref:LuxR family transcriptional regulator n=1 Tax=Mesobaculum littorinae TaxID=2486419 RepID=A0A438ALI0_9RHOB|nr:LuxR family transcriptional regulator [Mesobaculum littorinae]RVV99494.1 LuxR family transcriptional regulator [Mesobaculum littorinae]